jgi:dipeptidyl aminopeptidase/acylaminoacyl peptidase
MNEGQSAQKGFDRAGRKLSTRVDGPAVYNPPALAGLKSVVGGHDGDAAKTEEVHMKPHRWIILPLMAVLLNLTGPPLRGDVLEKTKVIGGITVHYKVVLPKNYDATKTYPGVLGFGGGPQTMDVVDRVIGRNFREEAEKRGYIVVVPAAPNDQLFFEGGERIFPEFLKQLLADYKIQDKKFHVAGPSNGGIAAFHVASLHPEYFLSITAFPGYLWEETPAHIEAISKMCINMFVGELDPMGWQPLMQKQTSEFRARGMTAQYTVEKGQPHRLDTLAGPNAGRLFDLFEQAKHGCGK